jgi:LysR family transcriptional regulator for metE and metH
LLSYQPLFDFELVLIVADSHPLAGRAEITPDDLRSETVLTYPVARERLDMFRKVLQPAGIEPTAHIPVEETDIMLQLVAAGRGVCLLPEWLLADKHAKLGLTGLRFAGLPIGKTMYLACRHEDVGLEYLCWLVEHAGGAVR